MGTSFTETQKIEITADKIEFEGEFHIDRNIANIVYDSDSRHVACIIDKINYLSPNDDISLDTIIKTDF